MHYRKKKVINYNNIELDRTQRMLLNNIAHHWLVVAVPFFVLGQRLEHVFSFARKKCNN